MSEFQCVTKVLSGPNAMEHLKKICPSRVLLVTDPYFTKNGAAKEVAAYFDGASVEIFDEVVPDPPAALAAKGAALCEQYRPVVLAALGGGSVIDCAKGIRAACEHPMLFVAVPTTSGSGSEMTSYAVLTKDGVKYPLTDPGLRPDVTILDDRYLGQLPPALIAETGMDLLAHCMEALVGTNRSGFTDALSMHGIRTVLNSLTASYAGDRSVRMTLHEAAAMAGLAFENAGLGLCHGLAHSMGSLFHIPHGRLCAMLLPHVMECNAEQALEKYAALARACGLSAATDRLALRSLQSELRRLRRTMGLPENLEQAGVTREQWAAYRDGVVEATLQDPCCQTNPLPVTRQMIETVLKAVSP